MQDVHGDHAAAERALDLLGALAAGTLYARIEAGDLVLRNLPVTLGRGEAGEAGGEAALKLVLAGETVLTLSRLRSVDTDSDGRVRLGLADAGVVSFGPRPW